MAREKGMGNLQREKSGRWTMRVSIMGKRYCRSTRTKDRDKAERFLQRFLTPFGLGERRIPLAYVWLEYLKSPNRNELAPSTLQSKKNVWFHFAKWMERVYLPVKDLSGVTADMVAEYLDCLRSELCATTYNNRVCVLREMFRVLASVDNSKRMFAGADLDWARHERHGRGRLYPLERLRVGNVERLVDGLAGRAVCGDDVE